MFETCSAGLILHKPDICYMTRIQIESLDRKYPYLCQEDLSNILRYIVKPICIQRTWNKCPVCYTSRNNLTLCLM